MSSKIASAIDLIPNLPRKYSVVGEKSTCKFIALYKCICNSGRSNGEAKWRFKDKKWVKLAKSIDKIAENWRDLLNFKD